MTVQTKGQKRHVGAWILLGLLFFIVALRIILPGLVKTIANNRLEKESPYFSFHINDIDLHVLKGKYVVEEITGKIKSTNEPFLNIAYVSSSIPWKDLFKGMVVADVLVDRMNLYASQSLLDNAKLEMQRLKEKYPPKSEEVKAKDEKKVSRLNLNSFSLINSNVTIHDFMSFKGKEIRTVSDIDVFAKNLTPTEARPVTDFQMSANVFGPAPLVVAGNSHLLDKPMKFDVNAIMKNFELKTVNPFVKEMAGALIHNGNMDMYAEVEGSPEKLEGYVKPFVKKLKMEAPKGGFKFEGAASAIGGNLVKVLLTDSEGKILATKAPFIFEKKLKIEVIPILEKAVAHRAKQNIPRGLEDNIGQKGLGVEAGRQAQEAKEK